MKKQYSISFFAVMLAFALLLSAAYHIEYQKTLAEGTEQREKQNEKEDALAAKGAAKKAESYYLKELNGFVTVYLRDQKTIYEYTTIRVDNLPENVALQMKVGMVIDTTESLYSFLEGYSS